MKNLNSSKSPSLELSSKIGSALVINLNNKTIKIIYRQTSESDRRLDD